MRMQELLIILAILLLLFGSSKLPALGSSLGSAIRNFKKGFGGDDDKRGSAPQGVAALDSSREPEKVAAEDRTKV